MWCKELQYSYISGMARRNWGWGLGWGNFGVELEVLALRGIQMACIGILGLGEHPESPRVSFDLRR